MDSFSSRFDRNSLRLPETLRAHEIEKTFVELCRLAREKQNMAAGDLVPRQQLVRLLKEITCAGYRRQSVASWFLDSIFAHW